MGTRRGPTNHVRGLPPAHVAAACLAALDGVPPGTAFKRGDLEAALNAAVATWAEPPTAAQRRALVFAFWRTVEPVPTGTRGEYQMPIRAREILTHRAYRLPMGRLNVADLLQLVALLHELHTAGGALTDALQQKLDQGRKALKALGLPEHGELRR